MSESRACLGPGSRRGTHVPIGRDNGSVELGIVNPGNS